MKLFESIRLPVAVMLLAVKIVKKRFVDLDLFFVWSTDRRSY